jgi:hypothetical protein
MARIQLSNHTNFKQHRSPADNVTRFYLSVRFTQKPEDDGACSHLTDLRIPSVSFPPTSNPSSLVDISWDMLETNLITYPNEAMFL